MALPNSLVSANPAQSDLPSTLGTQVRTLKTAIEDLLGIPDSTSISAASFGIAATGLQTVRFQDTAADPATAGYLQRNATQLKFHDGTAARTLYRQGGTAVAVGDGGTGLTTGTSGGVLGYTAAGTLASSAVLAANGIVLGGGAGAVPTASAALTNGQVLIGSTGVSPVPATLTAGTGISITNGAGSITVATAGAIAGTLTAGTQLVQNPYTLSTVTTQAHGLGVVPKHVLVELVCLIAEGGYSIGDIVDLTATGWILDTSAASFTYAGLQIKKDATNIVLLNTGERPTLLRLDTAAVFMLTAVNWKVVVTPYKIN